MSKLGWILVCVLLAAPLSLATVTAHPPVPELPPVVFPSKTLNLIAIEAPEKEEDSYVYHQVMNLGLSSDLADSIAESQSYQFEAEMVGPLCVTCEHYEAYGEAVNLGDDFQIDPAFPIRGLIHYAWTYQESSWTDITGDNPTVGHLGIDLLVGDKTYRGDIVELDADGGDEILEVEFIWVCETDEAEYMDECQADDEAEAEPEDDEPADDEPQDDDPEDDGNSTDNSTDNSTEPSEPAAEPVSEVPEDAQVWAHDLVLLTHITAYQSYDLDDTYAQEVLDVKVDTAGGSLLVVPEVVPPPPVTVEVAPDVADETGASAAEAPEEIYVFEEDGQVAFASAPMVPIMLISALGLVSFLRRRWE